MTRKALSKTAQTLQAIDFATVEPEKKKIIARERDVIAVSSGMYGVNAVLFCHKGAFYYVGSRSALLFQVI